MNAERALLELVASARKGRVSNEEINKTLTAHFPKLPFGKESTQNYFRKFIPWILQTLPSESITEELLKGICEVYKSVYPNHSTLDSILTKDVRGVVAKRFGQGSEKHKMSKYLVKISFEEKAALIKASTEKVFLNNSNRMQFNKEEVLKVITDGLASEDPMKQAVALLTCSGSRPVELFEKATYTAASEQGPHWITQDYIAKSKSLTSVTKPIVHLTASEFIEKVKGVRTNLRAVYNSLIQEDGNVRSALTVRGGLCAKQMFSHKEDLTLYTTRKLYGALSYDIYSKDTELFGKDPGYNVWLNKVLGHGEGSIETSNNYSHISLITDSCQSEDPMALPKFKRIAEVYEKEVADGNVVTQEVLERLAKGVGSRIDIREFYRSLKNSRSLPSSEV